MNDVIIIGGSFAGLAAALQLGRALPRRKIPVLDGRIIAIAHRGENNTTVKLDTGTNVAVDILFAHPRHKPSASLHESLGLATVDTPLGIALKVDERRETSLPGIYAPVTSPTPSCPRSPRHHGKARWRVSSPSSRCWFRAIMMSALKNESEKNLNHPN